jgi:hypothetical protein
MKKPIAFCSRFEEYTVTADPITYNGKMILRDPFLPSLDGTEINNIPITYPKK